MVFFSARGVIIQSAVQHVYVTFSNEANYPVVFNYGIIQSGARTLNWVITCLSKPMRWIYSVGCSYLQQRNHFITKGLLNHISFQSTRLNYSVRCSDFQQMFTFPLHVWDGIIQSAVRILSKGFTFYFHPRGEISQSDVRKRFTFLFNARGEIIRIDVGSRRVTFQFMFNPQGEIGPVTWPAMICHFSKSFVVTVVVVVAGCLVGLLMCF